MTRCFLRTIFLILFLLNFTVFVNPYFLSQRNKRGHQEMETNVAEAREHHSHQL